VETNGVLIKINCFKSESGGGITGFNFWTVWHGISPPVSLRKASEHISVGYSENGAENTLQWAKKTKEIDKTTL
jgi:hypothetical protein